jgi:hypothetical protein
VVTGTSKPTPQSRQRFRDSLEVSVRPGQLIYLRFADHDPKIAQTGIDSVITTFSNAMDQDGSKAMRFLEDRRALLGGQIARFDSLLLDTANQLSSPDPVRLYEYKMQEMLRIEREYQDAEVAAELAHDGHPTTKPADVKLQLLKRRYDAAREQTQQLARAVLRYKDLTGQREELVRERAEVDRRLADPVSRRKTRTTGMRVIPWGSTPTVPENRRWVNAAWCAAGAVVLFGLAGVAWRAIRRVQWRFDPRSGFPVVNHYEPKPVVPIQDSGPGEPTTT